MVLFTIKNDMKTVNKKQTAIIIINQCNFTVIVSSGMNTDI
jgi:hypothetical protein